MDKQMITKAKGILSLDLIKKTTENFWEVDGEIVRRIINQGRTQLSCTCINCTKFIGHPVICHRKIAVILYETQDFRLKKIINDNLKYIKQCRKLNMNLDIDVVDNILKDLRSFI